MYEKKNEPLLNKKAFVRRLGFNIFITCIILFSSLTFGILGYYYLCHFSLIDSLLNASMILSGMGPTSSIESNNITGKLFASFYAIFSGIGFISSVSILLGPIIHRFYHSFHLEDQ